MAFAWQRYSHLRENDGIASIFRPQFTGLPTDVNCVMGMPLFKKHEVRRALRDVRLGCGTGKSRRDGLPLANSTC